MKRITLFLALIGLTALACQSLTPQTAEPITEPTALPLPTQLQPVQQPQSNQPPLTEAQVPRIEVDKAKAAIDSGAAILVDVRSADSYAAGHAVGAMSIPLGNFETNIESLSLKKEQWIITYCTWQNEHTSARAAFLMLNNGYENVQALLGGLAAWADAGYPIEP